MHIQNGCSRHYHKETAIKEKKGNWWDKHINWMVSDFLLRWEVALSFHFKPGLKNMEEV